MPHYCTLRGLINHAKHNKLKLSHYEQQIYNFVIFLVGRFYLWRNNAHLVPSSKNSVRVCSVLIDAIIMKVWSIHCVCSPGGRAVPPLFLQEVLASVYQWHTESRFLFLSFSFAVLYLLSFFHISFFLSSFVHQKTVILCTLNLFFDRCWLTANCFPNSSIPTPLSYFECSCVTVFVCGKIVD